MRLVLRGAPLWLVVGFPLTFSSGGASAEEGEEVVTVRGSSVPRVGAEPEISTTVISGEALREPGVEVADVLERSPGVQVNRTGTSTDLSTLSIRGDEGAQVPIYIAGIRLNDDVVGVADLSRIPLFMIQRLEVYRGASPVQAQRGGMNGAVLLEPEIPRHGGVRLGMSAGSFGAGAAWLGATGVTQEESSDSEWGVTVAARRAGATNDFSFETDQGTVFVQEDDERATRDNADFVESDVWLLSRGAIPRRNGPVTVTALFNHLGREKGVSGLSVLPARAARSFLEQDLGGVSASLPCGSSGCRLSLSTSAVSARLETNDPESELGLGAVRVDQVNLRTTNEARLALRTRAAFEVTLAASVEGARIGIDAVDTSRAALSRASEIYLGALGALGYSPSDQILVRGALRASCVEASGIDSGALGMGQSAQWTQCHPEGRLGAAVRPLAPVQVRASVSRGVRYPTLGERFGVSASTRGNETLEVERAWSTDLGASYEGPVERWGSFWVDAGVFSRHASELVSFRRSSLGYVRPYNVGRARFYGGEVAAEATFVEHVRLRSTASLLDPRNVSDDPNSPTNDLIPFRSQLTMSQELELFAYKLTADLSYLGVSSHVSYRSGRVADSAGLIVIPEQATFDISGRAQLRRTLDLRARVENVFGAARFDALGFPLPGRAIFVSAEFVVPFERHGR